MRKFLQSGDIGYTYGIHTNTEKATGKITKGTYITIWQKQSDGKWKFVLDTGTQGLTRITFLFLASEAKIPKTDNIENIMNPVLIAEIRPGKVAGFMVCFPIYKDMSIMAIPMLIICPTMRMVPTTPDATPRCRFSTELIIAFEFGEENRPKPIPIKIRSKTIR